MGVDAERPTDGKKRKDDEADSGSENTVARNRKGMTGEQAGQHEVAHEKKLEGVGNAAVVESPEPG